MEITNEQRIAALKQILADRYYDYTNFDICDCEMLGAMQPLTCSIPQEIHNPDIPPLISIERITGLFGEPKNCDIVYR